MLRLLLSLFCCLCAVFTSPRADNAPIHTLTIMADPSLRVPITLIARHYAHARSISVSTVFGSTKDHIAQIEKGAEANVVVAASPAWVDMLQQKGLIDAYSRKNIARNRLVLAGSEFELRNVNFQTARTLSDFTTTPDSFTFVMGDASDTAEGSYGDAALDTYHLKQLLEPHIIRFHDAYQLMTTISRYHSMGIAFRSEALLFPDIKEMTVFKPKDHLPILYQAVVIAGDNMEASRAFLAYLTSEEAWHILKSYGFDPA